MKHDRKTLIIAPHGDDEINLVGTTAESFVKKGWKLHLLLVTNGDYIPTVTQKRYCETVAVAQKMGISQITFLRYGDDPAFTGTHTFNTKAGEHYVSPAGHHHTYGIGDAVDYSFQTRGTHSEYCRENVREDMKSCIFQERADIIICVDFDEHADHRMTSLLFDEIMCQLLRTTDYRPIILKKFAYAGVWFGKDDYFCNPMQETVLTPEESFPYGADQEVRAAVQRKYFPVFYKMSAVYRLCKQYPSQYVTEHFTRMVNADALYYFRDCRNLAIRANVIVSSGQKAHLNDFKLIDTPVVQTPKETILAEPEIYSWIPDEADQARTAVFRFNHPVIVQEVHLYLPYHEDYRPKQIRITVGQEQKTVQIGDRISCIVSFNLPLKDVLEVSIQITDGTPGKSGIGEVEIFSQTSVFPWEDIPMKPYSPRSFRRYRPGSTFVPIIQEKIRIWGMFLRYDLKANGLKYYLLRLVQKIKRWNG